MLHLRPAVVVTVLVGLLMALTHAPVNAVEYIDAPAPQATPSAPMAGEFFNLEGQIPGELRPDVQRVYLWRLESGKWVRRADVASSDGSYTFSAQINATTSFRVTAYTTAGTVLSATRSVSVAPQFVGASVKRVCGSDNQCGSQAEVTGYVRPVREGRAVNLQLKTSDGWRFFTTPIRDTTDGSGNFQMTFNIGSWSQWNARQLRAVAASYGGAGYVASAPSSFMPGPTTLGRNVLRVDVAGGVFPQFSSAGSYTGAATLSRDGEVLINRARLDRFGVRGSSTSQLPKKPYNLRFEVPPTVPVFGMPADRSWTLLAMYVDQSFVRDKTALDLGRKLDGMTWNPDSEYVELFVNSEYKGAYLMTEKVLIDGDKVNVDKDTGMIMETDNHEVSDPRKGFRTSRGGQVFAFKDPDTLGGSEGITPGKLSAIKNKLATVEWYLYTTNRTYYRNHIDRDSAVDFLLAQEYLKDNDADMYRSKYFSWDYRNGDCGNELCDGRLHFGPLWDFDRSAGNVDATNPAAAYVRSYRGWATNGSGVGYDIRDTYHTHWFVQLWKVPAFRASLAARWSALRLELWRTAKYEVEANKALIGVGAANDRRRWAGSAKLYKAKGPTYDDEVRYVKYWLLNRFNWMDGQL